MGGCDKWIIRNILKIATGQLNRLKKLINGTNTWGLKTAQSVKRQWWY